MPHDTLNVFDRLFLLGKSCNRSADDLERQFWQFQHSCNLVQDSLTTVVCIEEPAIFVLEDEVTQPVLPMRVGQLERRTHDYKRHGVTILFAALNIAPGNVLGKCYRRHRSVEFLDFLRKIDGSVPADLDVHLVLDNYSTHKTAQVRAGCRNEHDTTCTLLRHTRRGSTRSNAGSRSSHSDRSSAARTRAFRN